jgi:predicted transcriptional regulator of viral defense system
MIHNGELKRITKGVYTMNDDITVIGFAFRPFYYGLENALTIRKLWEQGVNPVVVTPRNVRPGARKFGGSNYRVFHINNRMFFGYNLIRYYDFWIPVSDYEKTLIDFVYFKHHLRKDVLIAIKGRLNNKRLRSYLKLCSPALRKRVLEMLNTG